MTLMQAWAEVAKSADKLDEVMEIPRIGKYQAWHIALILTSKTQIADEYGLDTDEVMDLLWNDDTKVPVKQRGKVTDSDRRTFYVKYYAQDRDGMKRWLEEVMRLPSNMSHADCYNQGAKCSKVDCIK